MTISVIVAVSDNGVIGKNGKIPWKLSTDLARFKEITEYHRVVMGRKTFESIGVPLKGRLNTVITSKKYDHSFSSYTCDEITDLLYEKKEWLLPFMKMASQSDYEAFIIGGQQIYDEIFKTPELIHRVYITRVHCNVEGDAFFDHGFFHGMPKTRYNGESKVVSWLPVSSPEFIPKSDKDEYDSTFQVWENKQ